MRRKLAIARFMLLDGDALFLDEPFRGLDDDMRRRVAGIISKHIENRTLVLITHDEDELELLKTDRIIRLG